jgi:hypothetical protein
VNGLGLKHPDNIRKMKLLTFMQMAENRSEITFQVRPDILGNESLDKIIRIRTVYQN